MCLCVVKYLCFECCLRQICAGRDDEDEDVEETIQKRRGRKKKKRKTGKSTKKEKEVIEELKPPEVDYVQTGKKIYDLVCVIFRNILHV